MLVYLKNALARRLAAGEPDNEATLLAAIREGAVLRVRPKAMTVAVVIAGLLPIMWGSGTGSEVMTPDRGAHGRRHGHGAVAEHACRAGGLVSAASPATARQPRAFQSEAKPCDLRHTKGDPMKRRTLIAMGALPLLPTLPAHAATPIHVYKLESCDCCAGWVKHLSGAGFAVQVTNTDDTSAVRKRVGIPDALGACHTATVEGYAIEGHVPAAEIRRLLALKPQAIGLAVPSMPVGSPGMEYGDRKDPYKVFLIDRQGRETVFANYPK